MLKDFSSNPLISLLLSDRRKNSLLACGMLIANIIAAFLEGVSFAFLLLGFTAIGSENPLLPTWMPKIISQLSPTYIFVFFLSTAIASQLFRSLIAYLGQIATTHLTVNIQTKAQQSIYSQIFKLSFSNVSRYKMGDLIDYATSPPSFFPQVMEGINRLIVSILMIVGYLIFMFAVSWKLSSCVLLLLLLAGALQKFIIKKIMHASTSQAEHIVNLNKETAQNLDGLKTVHLFDRQEHVLSKIQTSLNRIARSTFRLCKWNHMVLPINEMVTILLVGSAIILGLYFLQDQPYLVPLLITYLSLTHRLGSRLQNAMGSWSAIAYSYGQLDRMKNILTKAGKEFQITEGEKNVFFQHSINFESVSFKYPERNFFSIKDVSFTIPKGKIIALAGTSGGGKSTILNLLLRLFAPTEGNISIDGKSISEIDISSWRNLIGIVNQDVFLFHDTVENNIRFGNLNANLEEIVEAAKHAGAHEFIKKLPNGYKTIVGEKGYRLSGGERQRISLARALIRKPEILVLDEATSQLDSQTERIIHHALDQLKSAMTIVIVAHRLATIEKADQIFLIENGSILEKGTHSNLIEQNGLYNRFWTLQTTSSFPSFEELIGN